LVSEDGLFSKDLNVSTPFGVMPLNFQLNKVKAAQVSDTTEAENCCEARLKNSSDD
jgi:hypothetical protein